MLSPTTDFIMYRNQNVIQWKDEEIKEIINSGNRDIETALFADDHFTVGDSEDALQISIHNWRQ
jgi:uncharacterized protein YaeQ